MSQRIRLHILEAADWRDGIITLLEPRSPYRPWRYAFGESRPGDYTLQVLGTDPVSVLTVLGRIDHEGPDGGAVLGRRTPDLVDLTTLAMMLEVPTAFDDWRIDDDEAEHVILALHESPVFGDESYRWGHSSVAAARILLAHGRQCMGCDDEFDLSEHDARDRLHIHTVDPVPRPDPAAPIRTYTKPDQQRPVRAWLRDAARDWPGVLCRRCHTRMRDGNLRSMIDFKFSRHPECPQCAARRTQQIRYGMPANPWAWAPWLYIGGCCPKDLQWHCAVCEYEW